MSLRSVAASRSRAVRVLVALTAVSVCLGAVVAYAATRTEGRDGGLAGSRTVKIPTSAGTGKGTGAGSGAAAPRGEERLPRPHFIESPEAVTTQSEPQFRFHVAPRLRQLAPPPPGSPGKPMPPRRFQCRLDGGDWIACTSPHRLAGLAPGGHSFAVRAFTRDGRPGPAVGRSWRLQRSPERPPEEIDPLPFAIESGVRGLEDLYPGYPPLQLPILVSNPNSVTIEVTSLTVALSGDPPNCPAENFVLTPSSVSSAAPLTVPAGGSVSLPAASVSAPAIAMLDRPFNQDACRGAEIPLVFSGEAHG